MPAAPERVWRPVWRLSRARLPPCLPPPAGWGPSPRRGSEAETALGAYGRNLGIAFQIADDILDWSGRQVEMGKAVGGDFAEGKATLPVILAFERGDEQERAFWRRTFEDGDRRPGDFEQALALLERRDALADTLAEARARTEDAARSLDFFPDGPVREALHDFAAFCVERRY